VADGVGGILEPSVGVGVLGARGFLIVPSLVQDIGKSEGAE